MAHVFITCGQRTGATLAVLGSLFLAGCGSSLTRGQLESQIEKDLNTSLAFQSAVPSGPLQAPGGTSTTSASVSCPKNASLKHGSVFYCTADVSITKFPAPTADPTSSIPQTQNETHKVKVTMLSDSKAKWEVQ